MLDSADSHSMEQE